MPSLPDHWEFHIDLQDFLKKIVMTLQYSYHDTTFSLSFWRTHVIFGATGTPVLDFWWHLLRISKPEWVLPYSLFCWGKCNIHFTRSTSSVIPIDLLWQASQLITSPYACSEVGLSSDMNGQSPGQKTNALPLASCVSESEYVYLKLRYAKNWIPDQIDFVCKDSTLHVNVPIVISTV